MIDQRFMDDLAKDFVLPTEMPVEDTMLAAGPITSDVPQTGVRLGRAGVTPQQSAKAGGLDKPLIALLDTLAGAMRGATGAAIGLPGDIRSIVDLINQEGAEAVMGKRMFPTSEEVLQSNTLPQVVPANAPNAAERQKTVDVAQAVGEFLPAPGLLDVPKVVKGATKAVKATKNMPVGMSTQMVGEGVGELGFYSAAKEAVNSIQQPKGTGEQFLKQIEKTPGVKPEEIKWTGLDDFLKSKKSVTKAEVQEFLDKNRVDVQEVNLDNKTATYSGELPKFSKYTLPGGENYREILLTLPTRGQTELDSAQKVAGDLRLQTANLMEQWKSASELNPGDPNNAALYQKVAESRKLRDKAEEAAQSLKDQIKSQTYQSSHFDQPNILAHLRVNDRVDTDGKKVLFVEEVQSDWHQTGRKRGYKNLEVEKQILDIEEQMSNLADIRDPVTNQIVDEEKFSALWRKKDELLKQMGTVPDAPFKTTWHELAMKRAIQLAAEGGYDRVAFTTGKTQAERYDLSKQIQDITIKRDQSVFTIQATDKNGKLAIYKTVPDLRNLDEYVGKDLAEKVKDDFANKSGNEHSYDGLDLQVGGEGMKKFYDQILPKFLDKYAKKWDAKTGMTNITTSNVNIENQIIFENGKYLVDSGDGINYNSYATKVDAIKALAGDNPSVQYIDVTPKMKESVLTKGQPLFAIGAGGAAVQQEDNK